MMEVDNPAAEIENQPPGKTLEDDHSLQDKALEESVQIDSEEKKDVSDVEATVSDGSKDDDDKSTSSTDSDDSDSGTPPSTDPELLLIKATSLKDEGNTHFKEKDYEKASRCYRRGTNTLKPLNKGNTGDEQVKALLVSLQTNLSMMCFKLEKHKQSVQVATNVLKIDKTNVKALYRRAVANRKLGEQDKARDDLREALKLEPDNVAVKRELASLKKEIESHKKAQRESMQKAFSKGGLLYDDKEEEQKRKQEEEALKKKREAEARAKRKADWEDECVKRMAKGEAALTFEEYEKMLKDEEDRKRKEEEKRLKEEKARRKKAREEARKASNEADDDSDDELTEKELAQLRGYKKTSDGRITSYFTREQSQEEKLLAAKLNAPKKIDSKSDSTVSTASNEQNKGSASVWNQAGTWEEKDTTEWCQERLKMRIQESSVESGSLVGVVKGVHEMKGEASVAVVSGKKRYIFDFHGKFSYEIRDRDTDEVIASGSCKLPDICSTHHEELEVFVEDWKEAPKENATCATECRHKLVAEVREKVKLWVQDFNETY